MADLDYLINFDSNTAGIDKSKFAINKLGAAMAALGVGFGASELANIADEYSNIAGRINIAVGETGNFEQAMDGVREVSLATNSNMSATAQLFTKVNEAGKELGLTQQESLELTKTINQAIATGGGSAQASEAAITQLTQALQSGVLRGDEFNSIMEQAPGISKALAASLGVTTGELRTMAGEGKLSSQTVIAALQDQSATIQSEYDKLPVTFSRALQNIQTQWMVLIGEFNKDTGATSKVVEWLGVLEDNMALLDTVLADVGEGMKWVGDQIDGIDTQTIVAMKQAFESAYEALKSMASAAGDVLGVVGEGLEITLGQLLNFNSGLEDADSKTAGFTKAIQLLNVAIGFISDGFAGISIATNLVAGAFYDTAAAFQQLKSNFVTGSWKEEAIANMEAMSVKAQEMYGKASEAALEFKSKGMEAIDDLSKTEQQLNAETLADLKETFKGKEQAYQEFVSTETDYAAQRIALEQKINEARASGDSARVAQYVKNLDEINAKEAESAKNQIELEQSKLAAAQEYAQQAVNANNGVISSELQLELATQNYIATVDEAGQVSIQAFGGVESAANEAGQSVKDMALTAAKGLGVDVKEALNQVSSGFERNAESVRRVADGYNDLKKEGLNAGDLLFASLMKLFEGAKSAAEIDEVRRLYVQFGQDGKLSTEQVEMGLGAINERLSKTPALLDETTKAFKALGIISQKEADKQAKAAIANYELVKKSGQASAEQLEKALDNVYGKIKTSGNASLESWHKNQTAALGLGKSLDGVAGSASRIKPPVDAATASVRDLAGSAVGAGNSMANAARKAESAYEKLQRKIKDVKEAQAVENADTTMRNLRIYSKEEAPVMGNQFGTKLGVENFLQGQGLTAEQAAEEARKLYAKQGKRDGALNFGELQGFVEGQYLSIDNLPKSGSMYLAEIASDAKRRASQREAYEDKLERNRNRYEQQSSRAQSQRESNPTTRIVVNRDNAAEHGFVWDDEKNRVKMGAEYDRLRNMHRRDEVLQPPLPPQSPQSTTDVAKAVEQGVMRAMQLQQSQSSRTIRVEFALGDKSVSTTMPESSESMLEQILKELQASKAIAGY